MGDREYEFVILNHENFEEVVAFLDKHFFPRNPLVRIFHTLGYGAPFVTVDSGHSSKRGCQVCFEYLITLPHLEYCVQHAEVPN